MCVCYLKNMCLEDCVQDEILIKNRNGFYKNDWECFSIFTLQQCAFIRCVTYGLYYVFYVQDMPLFLDDTKDHIKSYTALKS